MGSPSIEYGSTVSGPHDDADGRGKRLPRPSVPPSSTHVRRLENAYLDTVSALGAAAARTPAAVREVGFATHPLRSSRGGNGHPRGYGDVFLSSSATRVMNSVDSSGGSAAARRWSNQVVCRRTSLSFSRKMFPAGESTYTTSRSVGSGKPMMVNAPPSPGWAPRVKGSTWIV